VQCDFIAALRSSWLLNLFDMLAALPAVENLWPQGAVLADLHVSNMMCHGTAASTHGCAAGRRMNHALVSRPTHVCVLRFLLPQLGEVCSRVLRLEQAAGCGVLGLAQAAGCGQGPGAGCFVPRRWLALSLSISHSLGLSLSFISESLSVPPWNSQNTNTFLCACIFHA